MVPTPKVDGVLDVDLHAPSDLGTEELPARHASRAVVRVVAMRTVGAGAGVVVAGLLSRQLGPSRFGELSLIFAVAMIASAVAELGSTQVVVADLAVHPSRRRELVAGFAVLRASAGLLLGVAGAVVLAVLVDRRTAEWAALGVMATLPLAGISGLVVLHQSRLRPDVGAALSLGQSILWLGAVVLVGLVEAPFAFYGWAFLACGLAQAVASWATLGRGDRPAWRQWRPPLRSIVARSWPLAVATVLGVIYYRLDAVLVFELAGAATAGFYSAAYRFLDVLQVLPAALASVLLPVLARTWSLGDRARSERVLRLALTVAATVGVPVAVGGIVAGDRVASAVFGPAFAPAGAALSVLGLAFFSIATGYVYSGVLVATGRVRIVAVVAAIGVVGTVTADLVVIPRWGALGAAWVTVGAEYFVSSTLGVWIHRQHGLRFPWGRLWAAAGAGVVMAAVAWPLRGSPLLLLVGLPFGAYVAAALSFGAITREDLRALLSPRLALGATDGESS